LEAEIVPGEEAWASDLEAFRRQLEPIITETKKIKT